MECTFRPMLPEDWETVREIYQLGMDTNLATYEDTAPDYRHWNDARHPDCRIVALLENRIVGWATLMPVSSRPVYDGVAEVSIYVDPRVQRGGVGTGLLNELVRCSEEKGFWTLEASIFQNNIASIRLHERCGFRTIGWREKLGKDRYGEWRNTVLMERRSGKIY